MIVIAIAIDSKTSTVPRACLRRDDEYCTSESVFCFLFFCMSDGTDLEQKKRRVAERGAESGGWESVFV